MCVIVPRAGVGLTSDNRGYIPIVDDVVAQLIEHSRKPDPPQCRRPKARTSNVGTGFDRSTNQSELACTLSKGPEVSHGATP